MLWDIRKQVRHLFFFQAVGGIRDGHVTGVQTCALPISGTDVLLGELTIEAAATIDADYAEGMNLAMNYWFIIAATFLLTVVGTLVSQFIVEPRLGPWKIGRASCRDRV